MGVDDFLKWFKMSFTNSDAYREFTKQKGKQAFEYFFVLFTLLSLVTGLKTYFVLNSGLNEAIDAFDKKAPDFYLQNGKLSVDGDQPITKQGKDVVMIIDTTGKTDESVINKYDKAIYIASDKIVQKQAFQQRTFLFSVFKDLTLDKQKVLDKISSFKIWLILLVLIFAYIFGIIWGLVQTVVLAIIGLIINSSLGGKLRFGKLWIASVYAVSLPWLLEMLKDLIYPNFPLFWLIELGLAAYILYKGVKATTDDFTEGIISAHS